MADILEQFSRKPDDKDREYIAFKAVDLRQIRLRVWPVDDVDDSLPYQMLARIMEKRRTGTKMTLVYSFMSVYIEGSNLNPIGDAIDAHRCEFIEEFDPTRYDKPNDPKAPFIRKITLHAAADISEPGKRKAGG